MRSVARSPLFWLALITALGWLLNALRLARGMHAIRFLRDLPPIDRTSAPRVSICIAARDEGHTIAQALRSVLSLDYPDLEIILVDDRSTDGTSDIVDRIAAKDARLRVLHIATLPEGWLGKNYALQQAADSAHGELLLFTDADIVFEPSALRRAVAYLTSEPLDHLAIAPDLVMRRTMLRALTGLFIVYFTQYAEPWRARDPKSRRYIGIGAFNLVRTALYRQAGGHARIALRPDDDVMLGKLLKQNGARQDMLYGNGHVAVEWYTRVRDMVLGLERSAFAGVGYSIPLALGATLALLVLNIWPWIALVVTSGPTRWLNFVAVVTMAALYVDACRITRFERWHALLWPLTSLIFVWIFVRSTLLTLVRGGIRWRGTQYPLEAMRRNKI